MFFNELFNLNTITNYKLRDDDDKDDAYRKCFLDFLNLNEYDDEHVKNKINILYKYTKDIDEFNKKYTKESEKMLCEDPEVGICVMLSYDELDNYINTLKLHFNK